MFPVGLNKAFRDKVCDTLKSWQILFILGLLHKDYSKG